MHELSIAQDLIALIVRTAEAENARRVTLASVEIGDLSGVVPEALELAFEVARRDTVAAECELRIQRRPLVVRCPQCAWQGQADKLAPACGRCESYTVEVVGGREMRLTSIDVDDDDGAPRRREENP